MTHSLTYSFGTPPASSGHKPVPKTPRISRLMALALTFDRMLRSGNVQNRAQLSRVARVTRPRITQIMNLLNLAPDIQEALLFLAPIRQGRDLIHERGLRPIADELNWAVQRQMWQLIQKRHTKT